MSTYDIGEITVYVVADTTGFDRGISRTTSIMSNFQRSMQIAAGVLMRDLFYGFVNVIREATELGAEIQTLKNSFEAFTDAAGAQWLTLDRLREATNGMVSDVDLLTQANRMLSAGMPVDQIEELFSGAIKLGKAMGIDASMAIEKLTLGLVRQSWRLMDDLGIIMRANQAYEEYAKAIGTTTDKLSAQQKQLAWIIFGTEQVTSRVEILGDNIGETDKMMDQFAATLKNVYTAIGENLAALPAITTLINALAPAVGIVLAQQFINMSAAAAAAGKALTGLQAAAAMGIALAPYAAFAVVIALLPTAIKGYSVALHDLRMSLDGTYAAQQRLLDATEALTQAELQADDAAGAYLTAQENVQTAYAGLLSALDAHSDALARQQQLEEDLEQAQRSKAAAYSNFVTALNYAKGVTDSYRETQDDMTWSTIEAKMVYESLRSTLWGLEDQYASLSDEMSALQDTHRALTDELYNMREANEGVNNEISATNLELSKLTLKYHEGKISEEEYERRAEKLRLTLERLRVKQETNSIEEGKLEDAAGDTARAMELENRKLSDLTDNIDETKNQISTLITQDDALETATNDVKSLQNQLIESVQDLNKEYTNVQTALGNYRDSQIAVADAFEKQWMNAKLASIARDELTAANQRAFEEEMREKAERERTQQPTWPPYTPPPYVAPPARAPSTGIPVTPGTYDVYQHGGIVTRPTLGLLGEAGPEAVIPLSRMGAAQSRGLEVNITIENLIGTDESHAEEFAKLSASHFMRQLEKRGIKF